MKKLAYSFKSLLVAWLCLFSLADLKAIPDLVLCIGRDGHIELETAVDARCGGNGAADPAALSMIVPADEEHCGECSDILLYSESSRAASQKLGAASRTVLHPFGCAVPSRVFQYAPLPSAIRPMVPPPASPHALSSIRSVRLLV